LDNCASVEEKRDLQTTAYFVCGIGWILNFDIERGLHEKEAQLFGMTNDSA
jgi:hypothetical protein